MLPVISYLLFIAVIVIASASKAKKKKQQTAASKGIPHPKQDMKQQETASPVPETHTEPLPRQFESLESKAWADEPSEQTIRDKILENAPEGEDPCHADMLQNVHEEPSEPAAPEPHAKEWLQAIAMSEVLKRPCERQRMRRYGGYPQ